MAYTFATLYQEVGDQFDSQSASREKLWVNDAIHEIISQIRWSWSEVVSIVASVSGQADYVLTGASPIIPDFDGIISVRHNLANAGTTFAKLRFLKQPEFDDWVAVAGATPGIPVFYTLRGSTPATGSSTTQAGGSTVLEVWPVPNYIGSFKIAYYRSAGSVELSGDSDIPLPPVQFKQAIVLLAVARGKASTDQLIASNVAMQQAQQVLQALAAADRALRGGDPEEIVDVPAAAAANPAQNAYGWKPAS